MRSCICSSPARPFLEARNIVVLSTSTTKVVPLKWFGYCATSKRKTSCSARASFTLMCTCLHSAGKSAAALTTLTDLKDTRTIPPHPLDEASVALVNLLEWCVASYPDAPLIRWRASRHVRNSFDRSRPFWTAIMAAFTLTPVRRNFAMYLYIWYAYRLLGGTATDTLVHLPSRHSRSTRLEHTLGDRHEIPALVENS